MKNRIILLILCSLVASGARAATDPLGAAFAPTIDTNCSDSQYAANIWMTDTMQKVRQDAGAPASNACYLTVHGTQNEFVDFQVHLHDTGTGTANMSVTVSNFVQASPNSYTISAATAPPPSIVVYREWYTNVSIKTGSSATFYNSTGYYPDVLIPAVDPYWGQTTNAWPYTVAAGKNQSAWVDILIPQAAPPGYYLGSVTVKSGSTTLATMPVILAVWQWPSAGYMPSTTTLKIVPQAGTSYNEGCIQMYNPATSTVSCTGYPGAAGDSDTGNTWIFLDTSLLLKDHRYGGGDGQNFFPQTGSFASFNSEVGPLLSGTGCLTHGGSGSTCPLLSGSKETTQQLSFLSVSSGVWSNWQSNFVSQGWGAAGTPPLFDYLKDEPHTQSDFTTVYNNGAARHGYLSPSIAELVTTDIYLSQGSASAANTMSSTICGSSACLLNVIDWLVSPINILEPIGGPIQPVSSYTSWLAAPNPGGVQRYWFSYQACGDAGTCTNGTVGPSNYTYPNYNIDGTAVANRAFEWVTYLHGQTGELYYATSVCAQPGFYSQCLPSGGSYGPWSGTYYSGGWGDGTLLYFGSTSSGSQNYMGAGVTIPLVLPSVRMKLMRDGVQDYEYLNVLGKSGNSSFVQTQVSSWLKNSYTFEFTGAGLQSARLGLGNFMHALTYSASSNPAPPTAVKVITVQ